MTGAEVATGRKGEDSELAKMSSPEMLAAVRVRKDDHMEYLLFHSRESAENFVGFVETYISDSGAGNGYGAYWVYDDPIEATDGNADRFTRALEYGRIQEMMESIARARSGGGPVTLPSITYGIENDAIAFAVWGFEYRKVPRAGDMYRVFDWEPLGDYGVIPKEGRVLRVEGDTAHVVAWFAEDRDDGSPKEDAEVFEVPISTIMQIPDWLKQHRERRAQHPPR